MRVKVVPCRSVRLYVPTALFLLGHGASLVALPVLLLHTLQLPSAGRWWASLEGRGLGVNPFESVPA